MNVSFIFKTLLHKHLSFNPEGMLNVVIDLYALLALASSSEEETWIMSSAVMLY